MELFISKSTWIADQVAFWRIIYNTFNFKIYGPKALDHINTITFCLCFTLIMMDFLKMYTFHVQVQIANDMINAWHKIDFFPHTQESNHKADKEPH